MKDLGRGLIGGGASLAVESFRSRLLGRLPLGPGRGKRALDLGCGDGLEAVHLARLGYQVDAYDLEPHPAWPGLAQASRGRIRFRTADATQLGRLKGGYDLAFQKDMLHHADDPVAVLKHMRRLLKPGGQLMALECNRLNPVSYVHLTLWGGHQHFTPWRLRALLGQADLDAAAILRFEARVWPIQSAGFQALINRVQDLVEAVPLLRGLAVYHAVLWDKPKGKP